MFHQLTGKLKQVVIFENSTHEIILLLSDFLLTHSDTYE